MASSRTRKKSFVYIRRVIPVNFPSLKIRLIFSFFLISVFSKIKKGKKLLFAKVSVLEKSFIGRFTKVCAREMQNFRNFFTSSKFLLVKYACQKYMHIRNIYVFSEMYARQKYIICMTEIYAYIFRNIWELTLVCLFSSFVQFKFIGAPKAIDIHSNVRGSCSQVFFKLIILKYITKVRAKYLCLILISKKLQASSQRLYKK